LKSLERLRSRVAGAASIASLLFFSAPAAGQSRIALLPAQVRPSLVLVVTQEGMVVSSTTGFVIASDARGSDVVVPKHLLLGGDDVTVLVQTSAEFAVPGRVLARAAGIDVALVRVESPGLPALRLTTGAAEPGEAIALTALVPAREHAVNGAASVQLGKVDDVLASGFEFAFDSDTADAGLTGPVVDVATGLVIGLGTSARSGNAPSAVGIANMRPFLQREGIAIAPATALDSLRR
jgi:hypothetical protein